MSSQDQPMRACPPTHKTLVELVWETVWEACVQAFLVLLLGSIAVGIVSDIFKEMTPSRPPVFSGQPELETDSSAHARPNHSSHAPWSMDKHHVFIIVASIFFIAGMWKRLSRRAEGTGAAAPSRGQRVLKRLKEDCFGLIVGNAFGAMVSAMVLVWAQRFSCSQICWQWLLENVLSAFQPIAQSLLGAGRLDSLHRLFGWYGENQYKFAFWFLYLAAICDDLGLPNLKTLGRLLWRRLRKRLPGPGQPQPAAP